MPPNRRPPRRSERQQLDADPMPVTPPPTAPTSTLTPAPTSESTKQGLVQPEQNWYSAPKNKDEHAAVNQVRFMNKYWPNGQAGWAKSPLIKTFPPSTRIVSHLHSITVLCLYLQIDLQTLYEPGGYIQSAVGHRESLSQTNSKRALDNIKKEKNFERPVHRTILHREQDGRFDNDIYDLGPEEAADVEDSEDLPAIDTIAVEVKPKRGLESPSTPKSTKRQRSSTATPPQASSAAEYHDLTKDNSKNDSQSAISRVRPTVDMAKRRLSDPNAWLCDEGIDRSVRQILLYHDPSNFACKDALWLNVEGVDCEDKRLRGKFPKHSGTVFCPVKTDVHWSLVVIYHENGTCVKAEHHDSMRNSDRTTIIEKALKEVLEDTKLVLIDDFQQSDGHNCGVFVISAVEHLVLGKPIPRDLDLAKEREKWRDRLPPCQFLKPETSSTHKSPTLESQNTQTSTPGGPSFDSLATGSTSDNLPLIKDEIMERIKQAKASIKDKQNALDQMQDREKFNAALGSTMADTRGLVDDGAFWNDKKEQKEFLDAIEVVCKVRERFESHVFRGESKTQVDQDIKNLKVQVNDLHQERVKMIENKAKEAEIKIRDLKLALSEAKNAQEEDSTEKEEEQDDVDHTAAQHLTDG